MDYSDPYGEDPNAAEHSQYPDIDETLQYPWQGTQFAAPGDTSIHSVIDPRLYKDLFPSNAAQLPEQPDLEEGVEEDLDANAQADSDVGSDYEYSHGESSSEEESSESPEERDDDEDGGRRRRRRQRTGPFSGRFGARGGKGIKRGPRKPVEPSPEFKLLHSEAMSAFIESDYDRAVDLVKRAIQINPEMFAAHMLLSEIFLAQGEKEKATTALFSGAHTRPRDPTVWAKLAKMILDNAGDDRQPVLNDVIYCYSRVIDIDPQNFNARYQRAAAYRELGYNGRAATEYERILKDIPHDPRALRHLAEVYIDMDQVDKAVVRWAESVEYYISLDPEEALDFSWSEINIYAELYSYLDQNEKGLNALKQVARWHLGRKDDTMWEDLDDDREWDADDSPRRIKVDGFIPGQWPKDSYGDGLPLELRIKLGLFRLKMGHEHHAEALFHFEWLNPDDHSEGALLHDYADLFREVADALKDNGLAEDALRFYMPLQETEEYVYADAGYFMAMGDCLRHLDKLEDAENCYLTVADNDPKHIGSRTQLARLYDSLGMAEQALKYVNEAVLLERQEMRGNRRRKDTRLEQLVMEFKTADMEMAIEETPLRPIAPKPGPEDSATLTTAAGRRRSIEPLEDRTDSVQYLYKKLLILQPRVKDGDAEATEDWLDIADALLREFRANRVFYPVQRNMTFLGYSREAQKKSGQLKSRTVLDEMQEMASRLQESLGNIPEEPLQDAIPTDYHGISFDDWLDLFLQYGLVVAGQGEPEEAYDALAAAADASIWYHSKPSLRLIHICWIACALRAGDGKTLANEARWFIKKYQFVTDTYRLHAMLSRVSGDSIFHSPPEKKFMLRQIRAMDYNLPDGSDSEGDSKRVRPSVYKKHASLTTRDDAGDLIVAKEMDIALLYLYGHLLFITDSFTEGLNYFFRAYALDDQNPAVLLAIALCYIRQSLKRQSENRHYQIMQGLSFMHEYRRVRERTGCTLQQRQEMEFNFARVYHTLSLTHLAVDGYQRVLALGKEIQTKHEQTRPISRVSRQTDGEDQVMADADTEETFVEDFSREAAMALQGIHALNGDLKSAQEVTSQWLVI